MIFGKALGYVSATRAAAAATNTIIVLGENNKIHGDVQIGI